MTPPRTDLNIFVPKIVECGPTSQVVRLQKRFDFFTIKSKQLHEAQTVLGSPLAFSTFLLSDHGLRNRQLTNL